MTNTLIPRYHKARENCAWFNLEDWATLHVEGADARDFLQRLSTADLRPLSPGEALQTLFLRGDGRLAADAVAVCADDQRFLLVTPSACKDELLQTLEKFHFTEKLTIVNLRSQYRVALLTGPRRAEVISLLTRKNAVVVQDVVAAEVQFAPAGKGLLLVIPDTAFSAVTAAAYPVVDSCDGVIGDEDLFESLRVENGIPAYGVDTTERTIPLEAGLKPAISFTKGCFPGQEIVARINNLGNPANVLVGLTLPETTENLVGQTLMFDGKKTGRITSAAFSPAIGGMLGLGYVKWAQRESGTVLEIEGDRGHTAVVTPVPLAGLATE